MHIVIDARIRRASTGRPVDRLLEYLQQLDKKNHYTVLVEIDDMWQPTAKNFFVQTCKYKRFSFNPIQQLSFSLQLYKLKPDLVHFTITGHQPIFYFGKQTTFTHDLTMFKYVRAGRLPGWAHALRMVGYRFLMWQSHRKAKQIIVPTEYVRDDVYKHYLFLRRKIIVTLEASEPPISVKPEALEGVNQPFILHVGSPFPHKNIERLVEAFETIVEKKPEMQLVLAGKREYYFKQLEKSVADSPARENIIFPGFVSDSQLKWLYQNASVYALPSLSEGFGLPGLEAMVHGCPLASSNFTCLPEVYGDAAAYFNPEDTIDIANTILKVIGSEKTRQRLIQNGYKQVKKYSWKKMTEQHLEVFKSVLDY